MGEHYASTGSDGTTMNKVIIDWIQKHYATLAVERADAAFRASEAEEVTWVWMHDVRIRVSPSKVSIHSEREEYDKLGEPKSIYLTPSDPDFFELLEWAIETLPFR